ncbi:hypothetical protein [Microbacterium sp.]|uniref:hypothetical protein n=1 Tax=Microbacterium sp. TaxID=51671 RepID=UPI0032429B44
MPNDELKASDRLYYAIAALRGWDEAADDARGYGGNYGVRFGRIVSSILLAADDDREPVAITGALDDQGNGNLAVVYDRFVVVVDVVELTAQGGEVTVTVHEFDAIEDVRVSTTHNYFEGTDKQAREHGMELQIGLAGQRFTFPPTKWGQSPLLHSDAVLKAYTTIRDHRIAH